MKDHPALTPRTEEIFGATINGVRMSTRQGHTKEAILDWVDDHMGIPKDKIPESSTPPLLLEEFEKWLDNNIGTITESTSAMDWATAEILIKRFKETRKDSTKS